MSRRLLVSLLILSFFVLVGGGVYLLYHSGKISLPFLGEKAGTGSEGGTAGEEAEVGGEEEADEEDVGGEYSCDGEIYTNTHQGYKVCYLSGWDTAEHGYSQLNVGFDPNEIPEASEYGGMFMISVSREGAGTLLNEYSGALVGTTTAVATVGGVAGVRLDGTISFDSFYFPDYRMSYVIVTNLDRSFAIQLLSSPEAYEENAALYDRFVNSLRFLDDISSPPWGDSIWLNSPWPEDEVNDSFRIAGEAQGAFENTLTARLKTAEGEVIVESPITYDASDVGELGCFDVEMTFSAVDSSGTLEVFHTSPADGSVVDLVSVPLVFAVP